jgi:glycosyltransferase involved in cell wall biosynthesis
MRFLLVQHRPPVRVPRALIIIQNLSVPTDRRVWLECQALVQAGWGVTVICPRGAGEAAHRVLDGVSIHTYAPPRPAAGLLGLLWEFTYCWLRAAALSVKVARNEGFDVLQACNPPDTYWLLGLGYRMFGKRFVYDQHDLCPELLEVKLGRRGGPLHRVQVWLERASYRTADHVIVTNDHGRMLANTRGGVPPEGVSIVRSAPDPDVMARGAAAPELRNGRENLVCYLGIMGAQDGVDRLVNAIDHYVHTLGRHDTQFGLLGFGDCLDDLRRQVTRRGLDDHVTFTGKVAVPEITRWLSTAALGVTPDPKNDFNDYATMNKTLEYMAYGLPVVSFDLVETRRSAEDAALYIDRDDDLAFAQGIAALIDDPARRRLMGKIGRARIEDDLCWSVQARTYVEVYEQLAGVSPAKVRTG